MSGSKCHLCFSPEILTWRPRTEEKNQKRLRCHSDSGLCTFRPRQSTLQFSASCLIYWLHRWPNRSTGTGPVLISCESYCHLVVSGAPWSINQSLSCVRGRRQQLWSRSKYRVGVFGSENSAKPARLLVSRQGEPKKPGPAGPASGLDPQLCWCLIRVFGSEGDWDLLQTHQPHTHLTGECWSKRLDLTPSASQHTLWE